MNIKKDILFVFNPFNPDNPQEFAGHVLRKRYIDECLEDKPEKFIRVDSNPEQPAQAEGWKLEAALTFLNMLAETFGFLVNTEKLTFTFSQQKFYEGFNKILEKYRDSLRSEYLDEYSECEAITDAAIYARFREEIQGEIPVICGGYHDAFYTNFYGALNNECEDGDIYQISQVISIRKKLWLDY